MIDGVLEGINVYSQTLNVHKVSGNKMEIWTGAILSEVEHAWASTSLLLPFLA